MNGKFYHGGTHRIRDQTVVNVLGMKEVKTPVCEYFRLRSDTSGVEPARKISFRQASRKPNTISPDIGSIRSDRPMVDNQRTIRPRHALPRFSIPFAPILTSRAMACNDQPTTVTAALERLTGQKVTMAPICHSATVR
jgi:hypothetical protein